MKLSGRNSNRCRSSNSDSRCSLAAEIAADAKAAAVTADAA
jgi:hypothetical protein